jgi:hypothetical protein
MPTSEPLPQEPGSLTPSFATGEGDASALAWRHARLQAITAVRAADWPAAWKGFEQALSQIPIGDDMAFAVGLRADLSHTDWLSGHHLQSLQGFATALTKAEALAEESQRLPVMAVIALVLAGLNREMAGEAVPDADRLLPGTCSDPAYWPDEPTPPELAWLQLLRLEERLGRSSLFHDHHLKTAAAANPLIRWYHQQLAIRKRVRDDEPQSLLPHAIACARAFRALHESPDAGTSTRPDRQDPLDSETLSTAAIPPLLASLVLQQSGIDLVTLLEGWQSEVAEPSPETALRNWLQGALAVMRLSPDQAWELMQDPNQALDARLVAGLRALSAEMTLDRLFYMQCLVVLWAAQPDTSLGANLLQDWYPSMVRQAWQLMGAAHPAMQANPEAAEALLRVCLKPAGGWEGVRQILQTAQPALNVSLSLPILEAFQTLIGERADTADTQT